MRFSTSFRIAVDGLLGRSSEHHACCAGASSSQWITFLIASFLFIQVPGPSLLFTIGRALTVGRRDALLSAAGNGVGLVVQVVLVAAGLGAVVAASAHAYVVLKLVGAAYVVHLGVQAIRRRSDAHAALREAVAEPERPGRSLAAGGVVGLTNPKTIVFFVAFLPQFTSGTGPLALQLLLLGLVFAAMAVLSDGTWVLVASRARQWFAREPARLEKLGVAGGAMMIGLGTAMAATK